MNHVNLNTASETVRQVILAFSSKGTVFELDGHPIASLIPGLAGSGEPGDTAWSDEMNVRRGLLIEKEIQGLISPSEAKELEDLQDGLRRHRRLLAPLPLGDTATAWRTPGNLLNIEKSC